MQRSFVLKNNGALNKYRVDLKKKRLATSVMKQFIKKPTKTKGKEEHFIRIYAVKKSVASAMQAEKTREDRLLEEFQ